MSNSDDRLLKQLLAKRKLTSFQAQMVATNCRSGLFVGEYVIEEHLGRGYFGDCYIASNLNRREIVSLRLLRSESSRDDGLRLKYYIRKSRSMPPNCGIQRAIATGLQSGRLFLASEFIDGESIDCFVNRTGPLSPAKAIACLSAILSIWTQLPTQSVTFGHLRPSKILVAEDGKLIIRDVALANCLTERRAHEGPMTIPDLPPIHVAYMAPEIVMGASNANRASDIYSLGCLLYFLVTGKHLFNEKDGAEVAKTKLSGPTPSLPERIGTKGLQLLFEGMTRREPQDRFDSLEVCQKMIAEALKGAQPINVGDNWSIQTRFSPSLRTAESTFVRPSGAQ